MAVGHGSKEDFCFVFSMSNIRTYLYAAERPPEREKLNIQKRKEVPAGSNSFAMRVDVMYFMSISF